MKIAASRAIARLCLLALVLAFAAPMVLAGHPAQASATRPTRHHVRRHHRVVRHTSVRSHRIARRARANRAHRTTQAAYPYGQTAARGDSGAPNGPADAQPDIIVEGAAAPPVSRAAYVLPTPDSPPLEPRTWTVRVMATETGVDPDTIVAEPGQRIAIAFGSRATASSTLSLDLPDGTTTFSGSLAGGRGQVSTITVPSRAGRYRYYAGDGGVSQGAPGWLIVTPTAAGGSAPVLGARDLRIVARDFSLNPPSPIVLPGERVRITFFNAGDSPHNLAFVLPGSEVAFASPLAPGEMRTITLAIPMVSGRYFFYDPMSGNRDRGMEGTLMVYQPRGSVLRGNGTGATQPGARTGAWGLGPR